MQISDFVYHPSELILREVLLKFDIPEDDATKLSLVRFEVLTPDSFVWRLGIDAHIYYLYAEDFVEGLADIWGKFASYLASDKFDLVPVNEKYVKSFQESSPVRNTAVYQEPADSTEMMKFAATSGYYFVFLAKSNEDVRESLFSAHAPRSAVA